MTNDDTLRTKIARIIFRDDTKAGYRFDVYVIWLIVISVTLVIIDSVIPTESKFHQVYVYVEWVFTILFTIEYLLRLYSAPNRLKYATSFFGIVDLLAIAPNYIAVFIPGTRNLLIVRILRLLRIFRIFQMGHFVREGSIVISALKASRIKIIVFLLFVMIATILLGAIMYMVESDDNEAIQNIPEGIYWAIVTLTTVGYGDTIPVTALGKILASCVMILGYGVIAVPTAIVTAEISSRVLDRAKDEPKMKCSHCENEDHLKNALFCHHCGTALPKS